mmetsp:Transcript_24743/g.54302  ORF Transcript_24743/g.54302 Transcript_24743/m.54302 type:complete len:456 (+) Transcript_24743:324-1691(+)
MSPQQENTGTGKDKKCENFTDDENDEEDCDDDEEDIFEESFSTPPAEEKGEEPPPEQSTFLENKCSSEEPPLPSSLVPSIMPSFVYAGLEGKASFMELKYWIALSLTLDGRDKITKVLQYVSRLLSWWLLSRANSDGTSRAHGKRFASLYKTLGKSRKAFRLGRSINEIHKISSMGLLGLFYWHLKQQYLEHTRKTIEGDRQKGGLDEDHTKGNGRNVEESLSYATASIGFLRSFRAKFDANLVGISRRIRSLVSSSFGAVFPSNEETNVVWWKVISSALKTFGMIGYWMGDNANFLTSSGALDDHSISDKDRLARRKRWLEFTGKKANQFYFFVAVIGLATNSYPYYRSRLKNGQGQLDNENCDGKLEQGVDKDRIMESSSSQLDKHKQEEKKRFKLFLAVLKSWMDVIVFSNNPGIDLHQKWRGRKNHEAVHCLCGLISAGTSLCNNFPDANK